MGERVGESCCGQGCCCWASMLSVRAVTEGAGVEAATWLAALMPRWVRLVLRLPVLLEVLGAGKVTGSSGSSGVGRGGGIWMLVRSGKEPPVLCAAAINVAVTS